MKYVGIIALIVGIIALMLMTCFFIHQITKSEKQKEEIIINGEHRTKIIIDSLTAWKLNLFAKNNHQEEVVGQKPNRKTTSTSPKIDSELQKKYGHYTASEWRRNFILKTEAWKWHVFVISLSLDVSAEDAEKKVKEFRRKFPNHDFEVMPTIHDLQYTNFRYAIVIAQGIESGVIAKEIAEYARQAGIARDAFPFQQTLLR